MKCRFLQGSQALLLLFFVGLVLILGGCKEQVGIDDNDPGDVDDGELNSGDADVDEAISCSPGEILGCAGVEQSGLRICNATGDGEVAGQCHGTAVCREGECVEVHCRPNAGRCISASQPQRCVSDGDGDYTFIDEEPCGDGETCESGSCLNRCQIAERTNSYIGCEYWAVETDNALAYTDGNGRVTIPPEHRPPFAVVLANTETDVTARITVRGPDGQIAEAIAAREVRSDRRNPGEEWVTVFSETVDRSGQRIGGPHSGLIQDIELPPDGMLTLLLPNQDIPTGVSSVTATAYQVTSSQPVVAYQFNPFCCNYNHTNDASLLLPTSALTGNYLMMGHAVWAGTEVGRLPGPRSPTITVVAMEDETQVEVRLRGPFGEGNTFADMLFSNIDPERIDGPDQTGRIRATLNAHEVLNLAGGQTRPVIDLTGASVTADKAVALFSAHTCTNVPFMSAACDHLESQLFPLETWATTFVASPLKIRNPNPPAGSREGTYWKFLARQDGTVIDVGTSIEAGKVLSPSGENVPRCSEFSDEPASGRFVLNAGESCEFGTRHIFDVNASRPIMVGAFLSGQNTVFNHVDWNDHAGDPAFFLLPPKEQYRTKYTFLAPPTYYVSYITVTMATGYQLVLDGEVIDPTEHDHQVLDDGTMLMAHIEVEPGPHKIESNVPFGLVVYGYDNYVSYAYTGGLDLTKLNPMD